MKPEALERLLMDRALGRLEPDVDELLTAHLANAPTASAQAAELQELVALASETMRPTSNVIEFPSPVRDLTRRHQARQLLALAAAFVIGVGLTTAVVRTKLSEETDGVHTPPNTAQVTASVQRPATIQAKLNALPFWSNQRAYLLASTTAASSSTSRAN